ncbi:MAG TPA: YcxB family protein [Rhizomicrobium sp.]|jgi:type IV secretory pathway VirB2 component (pilin)
MNQIDYRADHCLSDSLALQFFMLRIHLLRRGLILAACMLVAVVFTTLANGAPLSDSLADLSQNAGRYLALVVVGLVVIYGMAMILAVLAWRRRPRPREIRAVITPDGITLQKDGFSYGARWADANLVTESRAAYLMRFNQLYMRLPKRGFTSEQDSFFREIVLVAVRRGANRLRA